MSAHWHGVCSAANRHRMSATANRHRVWHGLVRWLKPGARASVVLADITAPEVVAVITVAAVLFKPVVSPKICAECHERIIARAIQIA